MPGLALPAGHPGVAGALKVVIMGCGRVGSRLAWSLDQKGHTVTILDLEPAAFRRLPREFKGSRQVGNGIDLDTLRRCGIEEADAFIAVTQGDNRNVMASQIARSIFGVPRVLCRIYDPIREEIYQELGLETMSPTTLGASVLLDLLLNQEAPTAREA
jgi:trk system potassium uptake protein TrkA